MKKMKLLNLAVFALIATLFVSCSGGDDDNNAPVNEKEGITRMIVELTNETTNVTLSYEYSLEGSQNIMMRQGYWYDVNLRFFNGNQEVTSEILAEKDEHFIKFEYNGSDFELLRDSSDDQIGLKTKWRGNSVTNDLKNMTITLYHNPKSVNPTANSNFGTVSGGETDYRAGYQLKVNENQ